MSFFNIHLSSPFPIMCSNFLASYTKILPEGGSETQMSTEVFRTQRN